MSLMWKLIREDVQSVFDRDPAARNVWEVMTAYPGVHALIFHRVNHKLWSIGLKWLARFGSNIARWLTGIEIHPGAKIGHRFFIDHGLGVVIGETTEIGDDVTLYQGVTLGGTSWEAGKRHPTIGNNVVVGAGAKVLGPFKVGDNARIGSNAVVVKAVPEFATIVGVPGREVMRENNNDRQRIRERMAEKMGFDAYGATRDMPDPVANAINGMLDHIHQMEERVQEMADVLHKYGEDIKDLPACNVHLDCHDGRRKDQINNT